jgi:hypothetical protein
LRRHIGKFADLPLPIIKLGDVLALSGPLALTIQRSVTPAAPTKQTTLKPATPKPFAG